MQQMEYSENLMKNNVNSISFNLNQTIMHLATTSGFKIYDLYPLEQKFDKQIENGTVIVQSILECGYILFVTSNQNINYDTKSLLVWDISKQQIIKQYKYNKVINNLQISNYLLILSFFEKVHCRNMNNELIHCIDTNMNLSGVISVSNGINFCIICPGIEQGTINVNWMKPQKDIIASEKLQIDKITDKYMCEKSNILQCHNSQIEQICLNYLGTILATCSSTGTIIRLFDTKTLEKIKEFRRGIQSALINYLSFSTDNLYLTCCSDKDTIHLYKINQINTTSYFKMLSYIVPITNDEWSFAQISTLKQQIGNLQYKIILRTGFAFLINNYQEYSVVQIPTQGLIQIDSMIPL